MTSSWEELAVSIMMVFAFRLSWRKEMVHVEIWDLVHVGEARVDMVKRNSGEAAKRAIFEHTHNEQLELRN